MRLLRKPGAHQEAVVGAQELRLADVEQARDEVPIGGEVAALLGIESDLFPARAPQRVPGVVEVATQHVETGRRLGPGQQAEVALQVVARELSRGERGQKHGEKSRERNDPEQVMAADPHHRFRLLRD
jgi:hypothetical protein